MSDNELRFLNVDLDIRGADDLLPLLTELEPHVFVLNPSETKFVSLEVIECKLSLDETFQRFHDAYLKLSGHARELWDSAEFRSFNAGFEVAGEFSQVRFGFLEKSIRLAAEMNARLDITLYRKSES